MISSSAATITGAGSTVDTENSAQSARETLRPAIFELPRRHLTEHDRVDFKLLRDTKIVAVDSVF